MRNGRISNAIIIALAAAVIFFAAVATTRAEPLQIRAGTALAKLRDESSKNTVFAAAAAPVPGVKIKIPAWLRAHYRRNHSEFLKIAAPSDPTGGYPLALDTLYAWMLLHEDLQPPPAPAPEQVASSVVVGQ